MDGKSRYYDKNTGALTRSLDYDEVSYSEFSPKIAFDYADEKTNYYVSYGHSFNPPPLYQVYRDGGGSMGGVVANPDLDPETSNTFEIGMKKKLSRQTNLGISLYQVKTDDKNPFIRPIISLEQQQQNIKNMKTTVRKNARGVEFTVDHKFNDNWGTYFNYAWQQGKVKQNAVAGTNLKDADSADYGIPKHLLHAGVNYNKWDKFNAILDCQYERSSKF